MILIDLNQVMISNLMQQLQFKNEGLEPELIRHMVLNSIRMYKQKFGNEYGDLIICCDDKNYWRKQLFPHYKAHRKKDREKSDLDWNMIFNILNEMREDIKQHFPYKVLHVNSAEADDLIASMCHRFGVEGFTPGGTEKILILSSDKDFVQLQKYSNVTQYSPIQKKFVKEVNPTRYAREHILRGDRGDGIPNFLSADDTFVTGQRQTAISSKKMEKWIEDDPESFCNEEMLRGYKRNEALVSMDMIPEEIMEQVYEQYDEYKMNNRSKMFNYFISKKLKNLMEVITEF